MRTIISTTLGIVTVLGCGQTAQAENGTTASSPAAGAESQMAQVDSGKTGLHDGRADMADNSPAVNDIYVTARRREENLQSVPISVAVISGAEVQAKSLQNLQQLSEFTPNFSFANTPSRGSSGVAVFIRGSGQQESDQFLQPGVGVYQDGIYIAQLQGLSFDLLDVDRIEVLRGPQGTLFGKNTIAGAVNITSKKPTDEWEGMAEFTLGRFDRKEGKLLINMPLVPGELGVRLSGSIRKRDGFGKRLAFATGQKIGQAGNIDSIAGRALISFKLGESIDALVSMDGRRVRESGSVHHLTAFGPSQLGPFLNLFVDPDFGPAFRTTSLYDNYGTGPNYQNADAFNTSFKLDWHLGDVDLVSITGFRKLSVRGSNDFDGSPYQYVEQSLVYKQQQFSQEFQLNGTSFDDRLKWTTGVFYLKDIDNNIRLTPFAAPVYNAIRRDFSGSVIQNSSTQSYAVYAQGTLALTDKLNLTAGGRYSYDKKNIDYTASRLFSGVLLTPLTTGTGNWGSVSGTAALDYHINDRTMLYGSVSRGFKSGIPAIPPIAQPDVKPEYVTSYEAGLKSDFLDRRVRVNLALFLGDYKDLQFFIRRIDVNNVSTNFAANAGKSRTKGGELQIDVVPVSGLKLGTSFGYIDAKYLELDPGAPMTRNAKFIMTPKTTVTFSGEYKWPISDDISLTSRFDYVRKSSVEYDLANAPSGHQPAYGLLNGRVTLDMGETWSFSVFGTNLTNRKYLVGAFSTLIPAFGFADQQFATPREWGLTLRYQM